MENSDNYTYKNSNLYDGNGYPVMMEWERDWMKHAADTVCKNGGDILNVGHGLGLIDTFISEKQINSHTIIENNPDVLNQMRLDGWNERARVISGDWENSVLSLKKYDGIYFDIWESLKPKKYGITIFSQLKHILKKNGIFTVWTNSQVENSIYDGFCEENNFNLTYEKYYVNPPKHQHLDPNKNWHYIDPTIDYVLQIGRAHV